MTVQQFIRTLAKVLKTWVVLDSVKHMEYSAGGAIYVVTKIGQRFRILVEEE